MIKRINNGKEDSLINSVVESYHNACLVVQNPSRFGYVAVLCKLKPQARELIKAKLLDKKIRGEVYLRKARKIFDEISGYYWDIPDGLD